MIYPNLPASFTGLIGKLKLKADLLLPILLPILKAVSLVVLISVLFMAEIFMLVLLNAVLFGTVLFHISFLCSWDVTAIDVAATTNSSPMIYINKLFIYLMRTST